MQLHWYHNTVSDNATRLFSDLDHLLVIMSEALKFQVRRRVFMSVISLMNNSFSRTPVLPLWSCSKAFRDEEMHAWATSSSGRRNYVATFFRRGKRATSMQQDGGSTRAWSMSVRSLFRWSNYNIIHMHSGHSLPDNVSLHLLCPLPRLLWFLSKKAFNKLFTQYRWIVATRQNTLGKENKHVNNLTSYDAILFSLNRAFTAVIWLTSINNCINCGLHR